MFSGLKNEIIENLTQLPVLPYKIGENDYELLSLNGVFARIGYKTFPSKTDIFDAYNRFNMTEDNLCCKEEIYELFRNNWFSDINLDFNAIKNKIENINDETILNDLLQQTRKYLEYEKGIK